MYVVNEDPSSRVNKLKQFFILLLIIYRRMLLIITRYNRALGHGSFCKTNKDICIVFSRIKCIEINRNVLNWVQAEFVRRNFNLLYCLMHSLFEMCLAVNLTLYSYDKST